MTILNGVSVNSFNPMVEGSNPSRPTIFKWVYSGRMALTPLGQLATLVTLLHVAGGLGAEILAGGDSFGLIEPGKIADIIIVDGDPLADFRTMRKVVVTIRDGNAWYDPNLSTVITQSPQV